MTHREAWQWISGELEKLYNLNEAGAIAGEVFYRLLHIDAGQRVLKANEGLTGKQQQILDVALKELMTGKPVQYVTGLCSFLDLELFLTPGVLIPRPETEELVLWVTAELQHWRVNHSQAILDICTGSGCIAISLAKRIHEATVSACDISETALDVAGRNARANHAGVNFFRCDILSGSGSAAVAGGQSANCLLSSNNWDCIVSNPPYVRLSEKDQMHANVLEHEPKEALFVTDEDPLIFYRAISKMARRCLKPGGLLFFEINENLGKETASLVEGFGFTGVQLKNDVHGRQRLLKAVL